MAQTKNMCLDGEQLTIDMVAWVARSTNVVVSISDEARANVAESRLVVENAIDQKQVIYGLTTGFGSFKNKVIPASAVEELQVNLVRSHACGVGKPLPRSAVRAAILIRINSLIKGYSGVRIEVIDFLLAILNADIYPYVPEQGSVGSSGDLAPLCHIMLVLLGEGECLVGGKRVPSKEVLDQYGLLPLTLQAKEGLALSNGTSVQTAIAALAVYDAATLIDTADIAAALSVEVLMGSTVPFFPEIHRVRGQRGQQDAAANILQLIEDSDIVHSHAGCGRVQDAYSLRCTPQVHGAIRDAFSYARTIIARELNAATDNPLVFPDSGDVLSGGNFHGEPIAIAADTLAIAISELGNISERRTAKMVDPATSEGLPAFLVRTEGAGIHSGLMIPQYTAAALVSENKVLAHPASVDSVPTSANQEDHVSMGTIAARKLFDITKNVSQILAIEFLSNTQAYEFRRPSKLSVGTGTAYDVIRKSVPPITEDRTFYLDIEQIQRLIVSRTLYAQVRHNVSGKWNSTCDSCSARVQ